MLSQRIILKGVLLQYSACDSCHKKSIVSKALYYIFRCYVLHAIWRYVNNVQTFLFIYCKQLKIIMLCNCTLYLCDLHIRITNTIEDAKVTV